MLSPLACCGSSFSLISSIFFGESVIFIPVPLACVLETIAASLFQSDTHQLCTRETPQARKNLHADILRRRHSIAESLYVLIQVHMIEWLDDFSRDVTIEIVKMRNHAGRGINFPRYGDLHDVVMSVSIRIIALAIDSLVFGFIEMRAMQPVRSGKCIPPRQLQPHGLPSP